MFLQHQRDLAIKYPKCYHQLQVNNTFSILKIFISSMFQLFLQIVMGLFFQFLQMRRNPCKHTTHQVLKKKISSNSKFLRFNPHLITVSIVGILQLKDLQLQRVCSNSLQILPQWIQQVRRPLHKHLLKLIKPNSPSEGALFVN